MGIENRRWSWFNSDTGWNNGDLKDLLFQQGEDLISDETNVQWEGFPYLIKFSDINRKFIYIFNGRSYFADTEEDLKSSFDENGLSGVVNIWGKDLPSQGIPYENLYISDFTFTPALSVFKKQRNSDFITVICGQNNSGKSLVLKMLRLSVGINSLLLSCNRFYHIDTLSYSNISSFQYQQNFDNWERNLYSSKQNDESCNVNFQNVVQSMKNEERKDFFKLCKHFIGLDLEIKQIDEENILSPYRIQLEGRSLALASTGVRLFLLIIASFFEKQFSHLFIDEPELGLSPPLQEKLSNLIYNKELMKEKFPHIKNIFIATHSHIFLSKVITDNFSIARDDKSISIKQCSSFSDIHRLQFNLIGNNLETMYFPSSIVIVEGKTDYLYIDSLIRIKFPDKKITVISGQGDVKRRANGLKEVFNPLEKSPMRQRIFVVNDKVHQLGLEDDLVRIGIIKENIVFWSKNGIEYFYPEKIMKEIYSCSKEELDQMEIHGDMISVGDVKITKNDLSQQVVGKLHGSIELPEEFYDRFFSKLIASIS